MKGAILSGFLVKILSIIAFILVAGIFLLLFSFEKDNVRTYNIKSVSSDIDTRLMMNNLLLTPVEISGEIMELREMIERLRYKQITKLEADEQAKRLVLVAEHVYSNGPMNGCRSIYMFSVLDRGIEITESHLSKSLISTLREPASSTACIRGWKGENPNLVIVEREIVLSGGDVVTARLVRATIKESG